MQLHRLEQQVAADLVPKALVSFEARTVEGRALWVVEVPAGKDIPCSFRDQVFVRAGALAVRADVATLRDMILRRQVEPERWERRLSDVEVFAFILRSTPSRSHFADDPMVREDRGLYPDQALREGLVNAFAHRDYADFQGGVVVQVFPRRLEIWNSGALPEGVTPDDLVRGQISILRNPDIAHALYLQGLMEKLGRGGALIDHACRAHGLPAPEWRSDALGVTLVLRAPEVTPEVTPEVGRLLRALQGEQSRQSLQASLGLKDAEHFRKAYLVPAQASGALEMTLPEAPRSSKQRYRLTAAGRRIRAGMAGRDD